MAKESSDEKPKKEIAAPVRVLLAQILKRAFASQSERERIAHALGVKLGTVNAIVYSQRGGFDLIAATFLAALGLTPESLEKMVPKITDAIIRAKPLSDVDRRWHALDEWFDEEEKARWMTVMETYGKLSVSKKTRK